MAEKTVLASVDIDMSKAIEDAQSLKQTIVLLKQEMEKAKKAGGETSKEYIQMSAALKNVNAEYNTQVKLIGKVVEAQTTEKDTLKQVKAELSAVTIEWNKSMKVTGENSEATQQLAARKLELTEALKREEMATGNSARGVGEYERAGASLRAELREITAQLGAMKLRGEENTEAFRQMSERGGKVTDAMGDVKRELKLLGSDTKYIDMAVGSFRALGSAVQISEASMQLFGDENQDVQRGIQKMVAIQSILTGVQEVANSLQKESALMMTINAVKTKVLAGAQAIYTAAVGTSTGALRIFKTALISTGIGAIIVAIGLLIANWSKMSEAMSKSAKEAKKLNDELERSREIAEDNARMDNLKLQIKKELGAAESELTATELANNKRRQADLEAEIAQLEKIQRTGKMTDEQSKKLADDYVSYQNLKDEAILLNIRVEKQRKEEAIKAEEEIAKAQKASHEARVAAWEAEKEADVERKRVAAEEATAAARKVFDEEIAQMKELQAKRAEIDQEPVDLKGNTRAENLEALKMDYDNQLALLEGSVFGELRLEEIKAEEKYRIEMDVAKRIGADTALVEAKYAKVKKTIAIAERDAKLQMAGDFLAGVAQLAGEQTAIGKAAAVAGTTIDTFRGAQAAFTGMASTIPGPVGIGLGIAAAAAAVVSGLANVKKILAVKSGLPGEGSVSASGTSGSASVPAIATVNPEIGAGIVSRDSAIGSANVQQTPQQILVVDEVTANQNVQKAQKATAVL